MTFHLLIIGFTVKTKFEQTIINISFHVDYLKSMTILMIAGYCTMYSVIIKGWA